MSFLELHEYNNPLKGNYILIKLSKIVCIKPCEKYVLIDCIEGCCYKIAYTNGNIDVLLRAINIDFNKYART